MFYTLSSEFGWSPQIIASMTLKQVNMYFDQLLNKHGGSSRNKAKSLQAAVSSYRQRMKEGK